MAVDRVRSDAVQQVMDAQTALGALLAFESMWVREMRTSEIRTRLLAQHAELRALIDGVRRALGDLPTDGQVRDDRSSSETASVAITRLFGGLREHNEEEERLLRDVIRTADAWGPARVEIMDERHVREHSELYAALSGAERAQDERQVGTILDRLLEHMAFEEKVLLDENVLRDVVVATDGFGG